MTGGDVEGEIKHREKERSNSDSTAFKSIS